MRSAAPQKLRSGNAFRKSVMNALMSSRPRRGSCSEYCRSMSGAASSSTIPRLQVLPQKSTNHRPTMALLSSSFDTITSPVVCVGCCPPLVDVFRVGLDDGCRTPVVAGKSKLAGDPPGWLRSTDIQTGRNFLVDQRLLALDTPRIARERPVVPHHAVAGYDDCEVVC